MPLADAILRQPNFAAANISLSTLLASTPEIDLSQSAYGGIQIPTGSPIVLLAYYVAPYTAAEKPGNLPTPIYLPLYDLESSPAQAVQTVAAGQAFPLYALSMGFGALKLVPALSSNGTNGGWTAAAATAGALPAGTYSNGTLGVGATFTVTAQAPVTIDGVVTVLNGIYLINNQASAFQNGLYQLTTLGVTSSASAVFTRVSGADVSADYTATGPIVAITGGTANAGKLYQYSGAAAPTIGTTAITFAAGVTLPVVVSLKS